MSDPQVVEIPAEYVWFAVAPYAWAKHADRTTEAIEQAFGSGVLQ